MGRGMKNLDFSVELISIMRPGPDTVHFKIFLQRDINIVQRSITWGLKVAPKKKT